MSGRVVAITQARMTSSRLPGKILMEVEGRSLLEYHLLRLATARHIDDIYVATTVNAVDDAVVDLCKTLNIKYFRGSEDNVLERYVLCAREAGAETVIRLTSDCPLIDPGLVEKTVELYQSRPEIDYAAPDEDAFPRGLGGEVFSITALEAAYQKAFMDHHSEHVTSYIYGHPEDFGLAIYRATKKYGAYRFCVDEPADFDLIEKILHHFRTNPFEFTMEDVVDFMDENPQLAKINSGVVQKQL